MSGTTSTKPPVVAALRELAEIVEGLAAAAGHHEYARAASGVRQQLDALEPEPEE